MSKILIIGAGISGLSIGQMFRKEHEVVIFEGSDRPGGLIKCDRIDGGLFHRTGGHVFNTKRNDVLDWFWSFFDKKNEFISAKRNAVVSLPTNQLIPYPIENNFHLLDADTVNSIINDLILLIKNNNHEPVNFEEFLRSRFGETLYNLYFKPYNEKVWRNNLSNIPLSWLEEKLPMPTVEEILFYNIKRIEEKDFVHSSFFYPKKDGSQFLAERLSQGLNIHYNTLVESIEKTPKGWQVNGIEGDMVIFCGNIKQLPKLIATQVDISAFTSSIDALESHGTTSVFCEISNNPYSWVYLPSIAHQSHRIICTGNFSSTNNSNSKMTATIEFTDEINLEEIELNLSKIPFSPKYIVHHYEKYTYPIQSSTTRTMIKDLKALLKTNNFFITGRFADWEYYNMDTAIGAAIDTKKYIVEQNIDIN